LVDIQALPQDRRALFLRCKLGIELYFDGASEAQLRDACEGNALDTSWPLEESVTDSVVAGTMLVGQCRRGYRHFGLPPDQASGWNTTSLET
jgi:hypothetical protein